MNDVKAADETRWSAWMVAAQRGDRHCYARLLAELAEVIRAYLRRRFATAEFVDDCVQECLIAVHEARRTYDGHRPFRPWLFAIVRHKTIDMLRSSRSYRRALERAGHAAPHEPPVARGDADDLLATLEPRHRDALVSTKLLGLSMREAAKRAGISEGAMKVRVHRALNAAKKQLAAEQP